MRSEIFSLPATGVYYFMGVNSQEEASGSSVVRGLVISSTAGKIIGTFRLSS
jgi:hypothetical protein